MTRDDIIDMAKKAGFVVDEQSRERQPNCIYHTWHMIDEGLAIFAKLVAAAEREAIADAVNKCDSRATPKGIAAAIRARGEK